MKIRSAMRFAGPMLAIGLVLAACSADTGELLGESAVGSTSDINPRDPGELRDGGNLRLTLTAFPATFNTLHVDADGEVADVLAPTLPGTVTADAAGRLSVDRNYFTDVQLTGTQPQQITYTINPAAVWSDGTPITWEDLRSQANALSGRDPVYRVSATQGYSRIASVERGVDDRQAIVTMFDHYAEWQGMFNPLYPKATTGSPEAFENLDRQAPRVSAGPFLVTDIDRAQQRIVLSRNPSWWGAPPKLETITFSVLDYAARLNALQNNELDAADISGLDEATAASQSPGLVVRRAPALRFSHMTFNGAPGSILEDARLRVAVSKAIDRQAIASAIQNGLVADPKPLNNHLYLDGQKGYQDNAQAVAFDPAAAERELDALGWVRAGDVRVKDGRPLELRIVMYQQQTWVQMSQIAQQNLAQVGVRLKIETYPGNGLFTDVIDPGNFDIANFVWEKSIFPLGALPQIYAYDPANPLSNKGRIGSPELNELIDRIISELDPDKAIEMANEADRMIFELGFSLPLMQSVGLVAQRTELANWGAFGLQSPDWTAVGFLP
ncbi:ABC transporter family substrate-binding protein [Nocardia higoensis]|uniref:ABC transporter family substrate-binding protein n=1 Tax=Nocardia higoensis TaxID=228599 RepID=A0ABS0DEG6_9NOCA|nr:ABC transporter family substrate-binding protein [Nocardia higoensis]MBF6356859.1 ABC transporter family substrate-binding protein [Nocardia higoensis]